MRQNLASAIVVALIVLMGVTALRLSSTDLSNLPGRSPKTVIPFHAAEASRLDRHLRQIEAELRARDVSNLTAAQRDARARNLDHLREYRLAGRFPRNDHLPGEQPTIFVDHYGTLCAMAYLIAQSGRRDIVERIAATRNYARIPDLASDPQLVSWLEEAGLTVQEAARIQPAYNYYPPNEDRTEISRSYAVASAVLLGLNGAAVLNNLIASRVETSGSRWSGVLGLAAGIAGTGLGVAKLADDDGAQALGIVNTSVGVASATLGGVALRRSAREPATVGLRDAEIELAPVADRGRSGLELRLRF